MAKRSKTVSKVTSVRKSWASVERDVLLAVIELCDGWTLYKPEAFLDAGVPPEIVAQHTHDYESDESHPKSTIYRDGQVVEKVRGVYGLDVIEQINEDLGLLSPWQTGRGFRAQQCYTNIRKYLGADDSTATTGGAQ